jgi:hypothetical protein
MRLILAVTAGAATLAATPIGLAAPRAETPLPPIAAKKTSCTKKLFSLSGRYPVTVMVAAQKGRHPSPALLTCKTAEAIALAGERHYLKPPIQTGEKITVGGAVYTMGVGGSNILLATSGPVYGWFGNGIEVLLINPSGD